MVAARLSNFESQAAYGEFDTRERSSDRWSGHLRCLFRKPYNQDHGRLLGSCPAGRIVEFEAPLLLLRLVPRIGKIAAVDAILETAAADRLGSRSSAV